MLVRLNEIFNFIFKRVKSSKQIKQDNLNNQDNEIVAQISSNVLLSRILILFVPIAYLIAKVVYIIYDTEVFIESCKYLGSHIVFVLLFALISIVASLFIMFCMLTVLVDKEKRQIIKSFFTQLPVILIVTALVYVFTSKSTYGTYLLIAYITISIFYIIMNCISNIQTIKYSKLLNEDLLVLKRSKETFTTLIVFLVIILVLFAPFWTLLFINILSRI